MAMASLTKTSEAVAPTGQSDLLVTVGIVDK
jgi:hypothetical protein